ncbi:2-nitropropane dioxygenase NPD [Paenibacillus sp. TCA20]|uniref:Probable nitronate monooxygenase n=1 Tax=Paenibacillus urinalis TaxID=521520 RepID=A0AAX3MZ42_9BACL|nr:MULTISPECIES: nitronate monooxygenase [Paenibacillus]WDH81705.1 nitronate monooxygenase [Paenibacillus urinalis]GAK42209.1 2-nitropropane dioxygenase NPD [Paenibacillus sp. TCA20]
MNNYNRVTNILGIKYPIVQAAMSWITDAKMVAAVSNAGGLGILGPHAGYNTAPTGGTTEVRERLRKEIRKTKSLTDKPFGVNLYMPKVGWEKYARATFEVALEEGVKYFVSVGEVNKEMIEEIKQREGILLLRELTPTVEGAKLAEDYGADIIIATGYDEGGWIPQNKIGTFSIVPTIADAVTIPVMATGGINDIRGVRASFALGAEGVYVGTRFIVSGECPAADSAKQDIINSKGSDLLLVSNMQRSTPHRFARELGENFKSAEDSTINEQKISEIGGLLPGMLLGDLDKGINSVNTAIDLIKEVKSCKEIIHELMADFINKEQESDH